MHHKNSVRDGNIPNLKKSKYTKLGAIVQKVEIPLDPDGIDYQSLVSMDIEQFYPVNPDRKREAHLKDSLSIAKKERDFMKCNELDPKLFAEKEKNNGNSYLLSFCKNSLSDALDQMSMCMNNSNWLLATKWKIVVEAGESIMCRYNDHQLRNHDKTNSTGSHRCSSTSNGGSSSSLVAASSLSATYEDAGCSSNFHVEASGTVGGSSSDTVVTTELTSQPSRSQSKFQAGKEHTSRRKRSQSKYIIKKDNLRRGIGNSITESKRTKKITIAVLNKALKKSFTRCGKEFPPIGMHQSVYVSRAGKVHCRACQNQLLTFVRMREHIASLKHKKNLINYNEDKVRTQSLSETIDTWQNDEELQGRSLTVEDNVFRAKSYRMACDMNASLRSMMDAKVIINIIQVYIFIITFFITFILFNCSFSHTLKVGLKRQQGLNANWLHLTPLS